MDVRAKFDVETLRICLAVNIQRTMSFDDVQKLNWTLRSKDDVGSHFFRFAREAVRPTFFPPNSYTVRLYDVCR